MNEEIDILLDSITTNDELLYLIKSINEKFRIYICYEGCFGSQPKEIEITNLEVILTL